MKPDESYVSEEKGRMMCGVGPSDDEMGQGELKNKGEYNKIYSYIV